MKGMLTVQGLPEILEYSGEFGAELVTFVPAVFWLKTSGLLGRSRVRIYTGMRSFYFFLEDDRLIEKSEPRVHCKYRRRPPDSERWKILPNINELTALKAPFECFPAYREYFSGLFPRLTPRPLLVIHNKFNKEWAFDRPVNYIPEPVLDRLFSLLKDEYQIVYIRHGGSGGGYSTDANTPLEMHDAQVLERHPEVWTLEDVKARLGIESDINQVKNVLYSQTFFFISTQGGGAHQCALFSGSIILLLHVHGPESSRAYTQGFYRYASNPAPMLLAAESPDRLCEAAEVFLGAAAVAGRAWPSPAKLPLFEAFSVEKLKVRPRPNFGTDSAMVTFDLKSNFF